jgi:hypothetical protein
MRLAVIRKRVSYIRESMPRCRPSDHGCNGTRDRAIEPAGFRLRQAAVAKTFTNSHGCGRNPGHGANALPARKRSRPRQHNCPESRARSSPLPNGRGGDMAYRRNLKPEESSRIEQDAQRRNGRIRASNLSRVAGSCQPFSRRACRVASADRRYSRAPSDARVPH